MKRNISIPKKSLKRLAHYHYYLKQLRAKHRDFVSNERLATDLNLSQDEVREDMANLNENFAISDVHNVKILIQLIEKYLGYNQENSALLVGVGNLGRSLLDYRGFKACGLDIVAVFDRDSQLVGSKVAGFEVQSMEKLEECIRELNIKIGIITTPPEPSQSIANRMVEAGIRGIWNFTLSVLKVPEQVVLQNSSLYSDFLKLTYKIQQEDEEV